ncbi:hypothetical protein BV133_2000 [Blastochloris viridis]|uniref:Uncharacterized protein n=1 Tax=Blastochloris viridis TaxID=1079 RepID=A0A182D328_BLAVI|nr:hypothetical protein BV133_2000 [Blastochloris viridis]
MDAADVELVLFPFQFAGATAAALNSTSICFSLFFIQDQRP